ncbi:MAG: Gldg family protein, partial [Gemmatimonadales bacterium]
EYRVSSFVRSLTSSESATVGFVQVSASPGEPSGYQELRRQISQDYSVTDVSLPLDSSFDMSTDVVVFPGDLDSLDAAQSELFHQYMNQGGAALVMARGMTLSLQQQPIAFADEPQINDLLRPFGITIRTDMVFDLGSNERIQYPSQLGRVMLSYPFWLRPLSTKNTVINQELEGLFLPWTSSIDTSEARAGTVTPLFVTTPAAGAEAGTAFLQPTRQFPRDSLRPRLVAVQVNTAESDSGIRGRLVVVGNNYFLTDSYLGNARENAAFALNAIDWLAEDEDLIAIRSKNRRPPQLVFTSEFKRDAVKYGNIAGIPGILVLAGALRLIRRRRRTRRRWGELPDEAEQDLVAASDAEPDMVDEDEGEKQ